MTLTLFLPPEIEIKLKERARTFGREVDQYAADLIRQGVTSPTFDELLAPVHRDFAKSGMTPDETDAFGRELILKIRAEHGTRLK